MKFIPRFERSKFPVGTKIIHTSGVAGIHFSLKSFGSVEDLSFLTAKSRVIC